MKGGSKEGLSAEGGVGRTDLGFNLRNEGASGLAIGGEGWLERCADVEVGIAVLEEVSAGLEGVANAFDGEWDDGGAAFGGHAEGAVFEGADLAGFAAGAFGEDDHGLAVLDVAGGVLDGGDAFAKVAAVDEDGVDHGDEDVDEGDVEELFFCNEACFAA